MADMTENNKMSYYSYANNTQIYIRIFPWDHGPIEMQNNKMHQTNK